MHDGVAEKVRLNGIDAPQKKQPFSTQAERFAGELAFGKTVTVRVVGKDRYRRFIGDVVLPDGHILNHELVKAGMAWWYRNYAPRDALLERLESEARAARVGLLVGAGGGSAVGVAGDRGESEVSGELRNFRETPKE
jgi:micrococcal nuclease